jgi:hypothetical protein
MRAWLKKRHEAAEAAQRDAASLIEQFGIGAYEEARTRARNARKRHPVDLHWDDVRREIARRTGRDTPLDTATRYLTR